MPNIGGWKPQPADPRDYTLTSHRPDLLYAGEPLAAAVDLRPKMPPVRDQGNLGSCTAFASAAAFEFINNGRFQVHDGAELAQYYNARVESGLSPSQDTGAYNRAAVAALAKYGLGAEATWPYEISKFRQKPPQAYFDDGVKHKATRYIAVPNSSAQIKALLGRGIPVVIGFLVYSNYNEGARSGIWPMPGGRVEGGHAVLIVGYDDAKGWWIIRNSWGAFWGLQGYGFLPYAYLSAQGSDFWMVEEVTGIAIEPEPAPPPQPEPAPEPEPGPPSPPNPGFPDFAVDISYHKLTEAQVRALKAVGCKGVVQCLWTGAEQPAFRVENLRVCQWGEMPFAAYLSLAPSHLGAHDVEMARAGVPDDLWDQSAFVALGVELDGLTFSHVFDAAARIYDAYHKEGVIYTRRDFWVNRMGNPTRYPGWRLWNAFGDRQPDIDFDPYGGWTVNDLIGEQYWLDTTVEGVFCDRDMFRKGVFEPAAPPPPPEPPAPEPEVAVKRVSVEGRSVRLEMADGTVAVLPLA